MSLRAKITLALLLMSFVAIAVVGVASRTVMMSRFDDFVVDRAGQDFVREVVAYHRARGSFREEEADGPSGTAAAEAATDGSFRGEAADGASGKAATDGSFLDFLEGPSTRRFTTGGEPPPFVVTDREGVVLVALAGLEVGDRVPAEEVAAGIPIVDGGRELGVAVLRDRPALTALEERHLSAMEDTWLYSLALASLLAVPLGFLLGARLARPMRDMAAAMEAMREGRLRQQVEVRSRDEVGQLALQFNEMSAELADAYEELESSRIQLDARARKMTELSRRDPLTGLLNRRGFDERVEELMARSERYGRPLSLAMIDIDRFKRVNDGHSHAVGDQVLVRAAELLTRELREADVVARYGGEEFVVAFPETEPRAAAVLAERLRATFELTDWSDIAPGLSVTISMGLADAARCGHLRLALESADAKLYRAKHGGRNRVEV